MSAIIAWKDGSWKAGGEIREKDFMMQSQGVYVGEWGAVLINSSC